MIDVFHNIPVLYDDNHLLVVDKPAGLLVQEDRTKDPDLLTIMKEYLRYKYDKPGNVFLALVHRLDRPVSGVIVLAKTSKAASRLSEQIRKRSVSKMYQAIVKGNPGNNSSLVHYLSATDKFNVMKAYQKPGNDRQYSELGFETIKTRADWSLVNINLITGRSHQIRVQMSAIGHPLWGDRKYGKPANGDIALRCVSMEINHPTKKDCLLFESELPDHEPWTNFT